MRGAMRGVPRRHPSGGSERQTGSGEILTGGNGPSGPDAWRARYQMVANFTHPRNVQLPLESMRNDSEIRSFFDIDTYPSWDILKWITREVLHIVPADPFAATNLPPLIFGGSLSTFYYLNVFNTHKCIDTGLQNNMHRIISDLIDAGTIPAETLADLGLDLDARASNVLQIVNRIPNYNKLPLPPRDFLTSKGIDANDAVTDFMYIAGIMYCLEIVARSVRCFQTGKITGSSRYLAGIPAAMGYLIEWSIKQIKHNSFVELLMPGTGLNQSMRAVELLAGVIRNRRYANDLIPVDFLSNFYPILDPTQLRVGSKDYPDYASGRDHDNWFGEQAPEEFDEDEDDEVDIPDIYPVRPQPIPAPPQTLKQTKMKWRAKISHATSAPATGLPDDKAREIQELERERSEALYKIRRSMIPSIGVANLMFNEWVKRMVPFRYEIPKDDMPNYAYNSYIDIDITSFMRSTDEKEPETKMVFVDPVHVDFVENIADLVFDLHFKHKEDYNGDNLFRDIMVFLPGVAEIKRLVHLFATRAITEIDHSELVSNMPLIMPITAQTMKKDEIDRHFQIYVTHGMTFTEFTKDIQSVAMLSTVTTTVKADRYTRRIMLCTNVLETSFTTPVQYVIDSGLSRGNFYNPLMDAEGIYTHLVTRDTVLQRRGRVNRIKDSGGVFYAMYPKEVYDKMDQYKMGDLAFTNLEYPLCSVLYSWFLRDKTKFIIEWNFVMITNIPREMLYTTYTKLNLFCDIGSTKMEDIANTGQFIRLVTECEVDIYGAALILAGIKLGCAMDCVISAAYASVAKGSFLLFDKRRQFRQFIRKYKYVGFEYAIVCIIYYTSQQYGQRAGEFLDAIGIDRGAWVELQTKIEDIMSGISATFDADVPKQPTFDGIALKRAFKISHPLNKASKHDKFFVDSRGFMFDGISSELVAATGVDIFAFEHIWYERLRIFQDKESHMTRPAFVMLE